MFRKIYIPNFTDKQIVLKYYEESSNTARGRVMLRGIERNQRDMNELTMVGKIYIKKISVIH